MSTESFILCTHPLPAQSTSAPQAPAPKVSTLAYPSSSKQDGRLCVVASGIGLGVYDLADQTPLSSITLGPSFRPTSSAVSRTTTGTSATSTKVKGVRKTWVGSEQGTTGEIWCWSEEERKDGSIEGTADKIVYPTESPVVAISAPKSLPNQLLLLSAAGSLSLNSEAELLSLASLPSPSTTPLSQILATYSVTATTSFLPASIHSLIPSAAHAHLAFIVRSYAAEPTASSSSLVEIGKKSFKKTKRPSSAAVIDAAEEQKLSGGSSEGHAEIEVVLFDSEVKSEAQSMVGMISLGKVSVVGSQVGVSEEGYVSALALDGSLKSYRLVLAGAASVPSTYADVFSPPTSVESTPKLSLTLIKSLALSSTTLTSSNISILSLHSSFVLLASIRPSVKSSPTSEEPPTKLVVLVWDLRLGALVSESEISLPNAALPIPSTIPLLLSLSPLSRRTASLIVSPSSGSTGRSVVFILPLILPSASVLAVVVGKHLITKKYLQAGDSITEKAKKGEPIRHPKTGKSKLALMEKSEEARSALLLVLEKCLQGLEDGNGGSEMDRGIELADEAFGTFLEGERERMRAYNEVKLEAANAKEKERRAAALAEKEKVKISTLKYRSAKRKIEAAISAAGEGLAWHQVTEKRIKNVSDIYRYKYYEVRRELEQELGEVAVDKGLELALKTPDRQEPLLPSTFVTALLRLCFPGTLDSEVEINAAPSSSARVHKHPISIVTYLLSRKLVGDGLLDGGVTRHLARAGDWPNISQALVTMPDIPEATTVSLLKLVVSHQSSLEEITSESSLPKPVPSLRVFLTSLVESPSTPSILRQALKSQMTGVELVPVLEILDEWLGWWASRGGGGGGVESGADWKAEGRTKPKRLAVNPFMIVESSESEEVTPPRIEDILPLVQAILDSHFVTLLLQGQSHSLLRRLSAHIAAHVALSTDLSTLLGALSIYARAREDQLEAVKEAKRKELNGGESKVERRVGGATSKARVAAQEKHAEVGEYVVDRFFL